MPPLDMQQSQLDLHLHRDHPIPILYILTLLLLYIYQTFCLDLRVCKLDEKPGEYGRTGLWSWSLLLTRRMGDYMPNTDTDPPPSYHNPLAAL